jgi:hypothetical protein
MSSTTSTTKHTDVTPYRAAQILTARLHAAGRLPADEEVAPQTMYGNKTITRFGTPKREGGQGVYFEGDSFNEWLEAYMSGDAPKTGGKVNVNALIAEYSGDQANADEDPDEDEDDEPSEDAETDSE